MMYLLGRHNKVMPTGGFDQVFITSIVFNFVRKCYTGRGGKMAHFVLYVQLMIGPMSA